MGNSKNTADKKRGGISVTDMIPPDVPESTREDLIAFLSAAEQELEDVFTGGPLMQPSIILALRHARDVYFNELNVRKKHILLHSTINISTHMAATKLAMMRLADVAREDKNRARTAQAAEVQEVRDIAHEETEP